VANNIVRLPLDYFPDPTKGRPVFNGSVYIGNPDTDPEVLGNRKAVTLRQEDGTEVPITSAGQPLVTGAGGVVLYSGSPVQVLTVGNYSIKVLNAQGVQVYYVESALDGEPLSGTDGVKNFKTLAEAIADNSLVWDATNSKGDALNIAERTAGNGGGSMWDVVLTSSVTPNTFNIVVSTASPLLSLVLRGDTITLKQFGVLGGASDDTLAIQAAIDDPRPMLGDGQTYQITSEIEFKAAYKVFIANNTVLENSANLNPLCSVGTTDAGLTVEQIGISQLKFKGNVLTTSGVTLWGEQATAAVGGTGKRSRNCSFTGLTVNGVGAGYALRIFSWQHNITDFTINRDCLQGIWGDYECNNVTMTNAYLTDCTQESVSLGIATDVPGSFIPVTSFKLDGPTVQSSGGTNGAIHIKDAKGTQIIGPYFEGNNVKTNASVYIDTVAQGTSITDTWNAGGAGFIIRDLGINTRVLGLTTSNVASAAVQLESSSVGAIVERLVFIPGGAGNLFVDNSSTGTSRFNDGRKVNSIIVSSFEPTILLEDLSGGAVNNKVGSLLNGRLPGFYKAVGNVPQFRYDNTADTFSVGAATLELFCETDNQCKLGRASNRWTEVFSANGTINTSDAREKTAVSSLSPSEIKASMEIGRAIGTYKFLSAVEKKGDSARLHVGLTVQRAIEIMEVNGLDPFSYGFICYDEWGADLTNEPGNIYSFRYEQLNQFIMRGLIARFDELEGW